MLPSLLSHLLPQLLSRICFVHNNTCRFVLSVHKCLGALWYTDGVFRQSQLYEQIQVLDFSFFPYLLFYFSHCFLDTCTSGLQSVYYNFLVHVQLEIAVVTRFSPTVGEQSVYSPPLEATYPVCHPPITFRVSSSVVLILIRHSLAQAGHGRIPALFYNVMGRENEKSKFRAAKFRPVLFNC